MNVKDAPRTTAINLTDFLSASVDRSPGAGKHFVILRKRHP